MSINNSKLHLKIIWQTLGGSAYPRTRKALNLDDFRLSNWLRRSWEILPQLRNTTRKEDQKGSISGTA